MTKEGTLGFWVVGCAMTDDPHVHESGPGLDREAKIREYAYLLWEEAGYPEGDGVDFWLQAEQVVVRSEQQ